jgi:uncharacterized membrane protein YkvI
MTTFSITGVIINLVILSLLGFLVYKIVMKIKNRNN